MRHYRLDALQERDRRLFLGDEPFTGIGYEVRDDRVVANYSVADGIRGGPAVEWNPARPRVLVQTLANVTPAEIDARHPEVGDYLGGELFRGVAYTFEPDTGMLLEEVDFDVDGGGPSREWNPSGELRAERDRMRRDGNRESVSYDENGRIRSVSMSDMSWSLTPELRLRVLLLDPGYPEDDLQRIPVDVDVRLRLCGRGVTDRIIGSLEGLPRVEHLALDKTGLTVAGLSRLSVCVDVKELVTYANPGFTDEDIRGLLARWPRCKWDRR